MKKCPNCGSKKIKHILYGLVPSKDIKKEDVLGGCVTGDDSPRYFCLNCKTEIL